MNRLEQVGYGIVLVIISFAGYAVYPMINHGSQVQNASSIHAASTDLDVLESNGTVVTSVQPLDTAFAFNPPGSLAANACGGECITVILAYSGTWTYDNITVYLPNKICGYYPLQSPIGTVRPTDVRSSVLGCSGPSRLEQGTNNLRITISSFASKVYIHSIKLSILYYYHS